MLEKRGDDGPLVSSRQTATLRPSKRSRSPSCPLLDAGRWMRQNGQLQLVAPCWREADVVLAFSPVDADEAANSESDFCMRSPRVGLGTGHAKPRPGKAIW